MWVAYNKIYVNGKPVGREFRAESGKTKAEATANGNKNNAIWNKKMKKTGRTAHLVAVRETGKKTAKKPEASSYGSSVFKGYVSRW